MEGYNRLRPIHHSTDMKWTNVKNTERKNIHKWEWKKRKGWSSQRLLNQAPPPAHPPCWQHPTHTHPKQRPQPSVAALTHCQTHYKSLHLHVYTQFLIVLAWSVNGKALSLHVGRHFCLFVWSPCQLPWIWSLEGRKERKVNESESDEEGGWSMGMIGWCSCLVSANERQRSVSIPIQLQKSVTDCNRINKWKSRMKRE